MRDTMAFRPLTCRQLKIFNCINKIFPNEIKIFRYKIGFFALKSELDKTSEILKEVSFIYCLQKRTVTQLGCMLGTNYMKACNLF